MIAKILFFIGIACLGLYGFFLTQAHLRQTELEEELSERMKANLSVPGPPKVDLKEGELFGKLEIPRLKLSVMVMEGAKDNVLRLGVGRVPGTLALAGHRDTFFRPLKDIRQSDLIRLTTVEGTMEYEVVSTKIVRPTDTSVLRNKSSGTLTLITCYPFYYIGHAPQRFIVEARAGNTATP
jgi:sortase A